MAPLAVRSDRRGEAFRTKGQWRRLVESCFLMQSLLCVRQYFRDGNEQEKALAEKIDQLWKEMEFSWYQNGKDVIYWHWSPEYNWEMNFPLEGYNEALIVYVLAASSPTYPVPASAYHNGWARGGGIKSDSAPTPAFGIETQRSRETGRSLVLGTILAHRSGPAQPERPLCQLLERGTQPCPLQLPLLRGEPEELQRLRQGLLGLTASYSTKGYAAHCPGDNDHGVITPTAALSSFPYTPEESMRALKYFYSKGDWIWGKYGFYDAFSESKQLDSAPLSGHRPVHHCPDDRELSHRIVVETLHELSRNPGRSAEAGLPTNRI